MLELGTYSWSYVLFVLEYSSQVTTMLQIRTYVMNLLIADSDLTTITSMVLTHTPQ